MHTIRQEQGITEKTYSLKGIELQILFDNDLSQWEHGCYTAGDLKDDCVNRLMFIIPNSFTTFLVLKGAHLGESFHKM